MVELDTTVEQTDDVTFVRAIVTNTHGTAQFVRLQSQFDGPIWIPRERGLPTQPWTGNYWERIIAPGRSVGIGFATPAEAVEEPLQLVEVDRASEGRPESVEQVLVSLADSVPPRKIATDNA